MIKTKGEFLDAWCAGRFGNKLRTWPCRDGPAREGYDGLIGIRPRRPGGQCRYHVSQAAIDETIAEMVARGEREGDLYFGEMAPDTRLLLQGEFADDQGRYLMYSRAQVPMRVAMAYPLGPDMGQPVPFKHYAEGVLSEVLLRSVMNENSWDDFQVLRERFPGHVIEFGAYAICLGDCPHRNTLIWEVRAY